MKFLIITNEIPEGGFTRPQLLHMIETAKAGANFYDGVTIEANASGALRVKQIPQSKVTDLVTALAGKQSLNSLLTAIAGMASNGLIERTSSGSVVHRVIGTDIQPFNAFLAALTTVGDGVLIRSGSSASVSAFLKAIADLSSNGLLFKNGVNAEVKLIGVDIQGWSAKLQDIADLSGLAAGDILQWNGSNFVRVPRQAAVGDVDASSLPTSMSASYDQSEAEGVRTTVANLVAQFHALRDRFEATGGNGLLEDAS